MNYRSVEFYPELKTLSDEHIAMNSSFYRHLVEYYLTYFEFSLEMITRTFDDYARDFINYLKNTNMENPVLVLGSGCGRDAFWASQLGVDVHLVDASESMIEFSKKLFVNASFFCQDMNKFLNSLKDTGTVYSGILNESAAQHLGKEQVYEQILLVSRHLAPDGIFLLGLKHAPQNFNIGPVYSVAESGEKRFFVSWSESEIIELIQFADNLGLNLVKRIDAEHLESSQGTPPFIRLYFSPTS